VGTSTFSGPIKAGDVFNTTGTTPGTIRNVGSVVLAQTAGIRQDGSATALATRIVIPANSHILNIQVLATAAWSGASSNISIGTSATSTELVSAASLSAVGLAALTPGTDATRTAKWENVGTSDVIIYALSANTGTGVGELTVRYIQAHDA
jgi:hypothetical protein